MPTFAEVERPVLTGKGVGEGDAAGAAKLRDDIRFEGIGLEDLRLSEEKLEDAECDRVGVGDEAWLKLIELNGVELEEVEVDDVSVGDVRLDDINKELDVEEEATVDGAGATAVLRRFSDSVSAQR